MTRDEAFKWLTKFRDSASVVLDGNRYTFYAMSTEKLYEALCVAIESIQALEKIEDIAKDVLGREVMP